MDIYFAYQKLPGGKMSRKKAQEKPNGSKNGVSLPKEKRVYMPSSMLPLKTLRDALRVPQTIIDQFAGKPTQPHQIAMALDLSPTSNTWRDLAASSLGYGLTKGSWNATAITLDTLGLRATAPTKEGDDLSAKAEAVLKPKVLGEFFRKYNKNKFPSDNITLNVLNQEFKVPKERVGVALKIIKDNGQFVGFLHETKTGLYVAIEDPRPTPVIMPPEPEEANISKAEVSISGTETSIDAGQQRELWSFKVFIAHGKNHAIINQVKEILETYDIEYEIAVEEETAAIPVPSKVMAAMRRCQAGVMIVTTDEQNASGDDFTINMNVLIEIGAAFVLYDQGVILLWDRRLKVPSNLQGLYRLEFEGGELTFSTGIKLTKAIKSIKEKKVLKP
ncbi:MAG: hypothetical protein C4524_00275 [Candidatus Zixiibacteriota bacterium]|nr:MAG: hypothetical protein C4524_00275 [candidate division Zixibacteria bacterium]